MKRVNDRLGLSVTRASVLLVISALIGGLAGLMSILLCYFLLSFGGSEDADKHGIATLPAARIGGVLLVTYLLINVFFQSWMLELSSINPLSSAVLAASLPFFCLGLYEDWYGVLGARFRFTFMLIVAAIVMWCLPMFVILPTGVWLFDALVFNYSVIAWVVSAISLAFMPNAFNTADGANGLVAGVSLLASIALSLVAPPDLIPLLRSVAIASALFLLYNLITGRFFLGDGGAYFLGALTSLCLIVVANSSVVSIWYLLSLVFYPIADLLFSIARRSYAGRSPFSADNEHLHNLIFAFLVTGPSDTKRMNTLTGLSVVIVFSGTVVAVNSLGLIASRSPSWFVVFALLCLVYVILWKALYRRVCVIGQTQTL